ncbi:3080_t:CDS:1, partial [Gigaspora rosea]
MMPKRNSESNVKNQQEKKILRKHIHEVPRKFLRRKKLSHSKLYQTYPSCKLQHLSTTKEQRNRNQDPSATNKPKAPVSQKNIEIATKDPRATKNNEFTIITAPTTKL